MEDVRQSCRVSKAAPLLGADTEAIRTSLLKLSNEQIQELRRREITV
jgi:crotonobetainyl-CoA:carnitine CoA-transferase CaiB-like acyl-CoA transferase